MKRKIIREDGAVQIVEASFVFPIMFLVLFFLVFLGNAFLVESHIESVVSSAAIEGANYCADPILDSIRSSGGTVPGLDNIGIRPYRYVPLFGDMNIVKDRVNKSVYEKITKSSASLFNRMNPVIKTHKSEISSFNNYVLYSTFSVGVKCEISFPIRFFGQATPILFTVDSYSEVAVNDVTEFIRNTDMVLDYFENSKVVSSVRSVFKKINDFIDKFASK